MTEDRKRLGLFTHLSVGENITICTLEQSCTAGLIRRRHEDAQARGIVERLNVKTGRHRGPDHQP